MPKHTARTAVVGALLLVIVTGTAFGGDDLGVERIDEAIDKGIEYLFSSQNADGSWPGHHEGHGQPLGPTGLCTYALLHAGVSPADERIVKAFRFMTNNPATKTYGVACYASAYGEAVMKGAKQYRRHLRQMGSLLIKSARRHSRGAYTYDLMKYDTFDLSNTNYGVFGVWVAQRVLGEVPKAYWHRTAQHWIDCQKDDGSWGYKDKDATRIALAAAGVASLFVCFDNLNASRFAKCGVDFASDPIYTHIQEALDWFDENFAVPIPGHIKGYSGNYYYLYNVERVGLAAGYKYFGKKDWFKMGTRFLLRAQRGNGAFPGKFGPDASTSFALLFLARGREPVMFNKLQFDGDWNNRPRDCAYVTRWAGPEFEHNFNWQIINLQVAPEDWHDAPIVYISGSQKPTFSEEELDKLRRYVHQGGTILSVAECSGKAFSDGMREVYKQLFPEYELTPCSPRHELYSAHFNLQGRPGFSIITNGVRPFAIHTDADLARAWQARKHETGGYAFRAAANVYFYVTDKRYRLRGEKTWPKRSRRNDRGEVTVVRVKHAGNWNPEPLAWERFGRLLCHRERWRVERDEPVTAEELAKSDAQMATMTGTEAFELTPKQRELLRQYVAAGGTLVIDAAGGRRAFGEAAEKMIRQIWGGGALERLSDRSPLYTRDGHAIEKVSYRRRTQVRGAPSGPALRAVRVMGRPAVIYSRHDLTTGLAGVRAYRCDGYTPKTAYELMRNVVISVGQR
ncbi:MAG: DUF4159 domain-containing protein [Phycisphaerae bacterium]|nr:DUF4159 domain-containing protein [Phycisphaerae bacterium]